MLGKHLQFLLQKPSDNLRGRRFARQLGATDTQYSATRRQNRRVEKRTESGAFPCTCGRLEGGKGRICGICGRRRLCRCGLVSPFAPKNHPREQRNGCGQHRQRGRKHALHLLQQLSQFQRCPRKIAGRRSCASLFCNRKEVAFCGIRCGTNCTAGRFWTDACPTFRK